MSALHQIKKKEMLANTKYVSNENVPNENFNSIKVK